MSEWYERMRKIREDHKMSQAAFGRAIHKDGTQISRYERGAVKDFPNALYRLLGDILSEDEIDYIINGERNMVEDVGVPYNTQLSIPVLSIKAAAGGGGNNVESVDLFETGRAITVDRSLFKAPPSSRLRAVQADGYSMVPMLYPDSWVIFEETGEWSGDGLYVLIFRNVLMVKLVEADPATGQLAIRSVNPDYESWAYDPTQDQSTMRIVGRVLRCVV